MKLGYRLYIYVGCHFFIEQHNLSSKMTVINKLLRKRKKQNKKQNKTKTVNIRRETILNFRELKNFRGIFITSVISKLFEKVIYERIVQIASVNPS